MEGRLSGVRIVVVVPTYNEAENIGALVRQILDILPEAGVMVVDDNSPDGTAEVVKKAIQKEENRGRVALLCREKKEGLGKAYIHAFKKLLDIPDIRHVVMMDADFSHNPSVLPAMVQNAHKFDVVIGSRYVSGGNTVGWNLRRRLLSRFGNMYARSITHIPVHDMTGGFNLISTDILRKINLDSLSARGYAFIMELKHALYLAGARFGEIPISFRDREKGQSKISGGIVREGLFVPWRLRMKNTKNIHTKLAAGFAGMFFVLGFWHAFPLTSVYFDEMYFAGGVLRAISAHSIFPQGVDVPYGTLTYICVYPLMLVWLAIAYFAAGSVNAVQNLFVAHAWLSYVPVRLFTALVMVVTAVMLERFWRKYLPSAAERFSALVLLFTNILVLTVGHSGKTWVLSTALFVFSFVCLVRAIETKNARCSFLAIFFSFLAFANFPLMGISLVSFLVLLWIWRRSKYRVSQICAFAVASALAFALVFSFNSTGIPFQVHSTVFDFFIGGDERGTNLSFVWSFILYLVRTFLFFPLILLPIFASREGKDKRVLLKTAVGYVFVYLLAVSFVARWSTDIHSFVRYLYPLPFLLVHVLVAREQSRKVLFGSAAVSLVVGIFVLAKLCIPTTWNQAQTWVIHNLKYENIYILNNAYPELQLPKNIESYKIIGDEYCGSRCRAVLAGAKEDFRPVVVDAQVGQGKDNLYEKKDGVVFITTNATTTAGKLIAKFESGTYDGRELTAENLADYFDPAFWYAHRFGRNIYIYER